MGTQKGELLYSFFAVDSMDYLVIDKDGRYDAPVLRGICSTMYAITKPLIWNSSKPCMGA